MQHHQNPATAAFALRLTMSTRVWHRHLNSWLGTICRDLAAFTHTLGTRQLSYWDGRDAQSLGDSGFNIATFCLREPSMHSIAISVSRLRLASRCSWLERLPQFISLAKPRVMALALFTAFVGLMIAPAHLDPLPGSIAILAIAAGAGAAGALNMWYDADIDAVMARTAMRPIPRGKVSKIEAFAFGLVLGVMAVTVLALAANVAAAALLAFTILFYVVV